MAILQGFPVTKFHAAFVSTTGGLDPPKNARKLQLRRQSISNWVLIAVFHVPMDFPKNELLSEKVPPKDEFVFWAGWKRKKKAHPFFFRPAW